MAHGICPGCKREFSRRGTGEFCSKSCREGHEERERLKEAGVPNRRMAKPPGNSEDQRRRAKMRKTRQAEEKAREAVVENGIGAELELVKERSAADLGGEGLLITRVRAVGDAKRARDWPVLKDALVDLAAVAVSWASRIDAVDGEDPLPPAHTLVPAGEGLNGHAEDGSARSVADRYADVLLNAAANGLDGREARSTIERLLGVGL